MSQSENLEIEFKGLASLLLDGKLKVPEYQRNYAWSHKEVGDLLLDIEECIATKQTDYFLGTVVLIKKSGTRNDIIDGQQRLATVSLVICAIRDFLLKKLDEKRAIQIESDFLSKTDLRTQVLEAKLILNGSDHKFYSEQMLVKPSLRPEVNNSVTDSQVRLATAYEVISDKVAKLASSNIEALFDWIDFLRDYAKVIIVKAANESNAYTIFETLNDRGLDLAVTDLLKNYLFSLAEDQIEIVRESWYQCIGILEGYGGEDLFKDFIRVHWASQNGLIRERHLYSTLKREIRLKSHAVDFSGNIRNSVVLFEALLNPESSVWSDHPQSTKEAIQTLNLFSVKIHRPLLLSALRNFSVVEFGQLIGFVKNWTVRCAVCGSTPGPIESVVCSIAKKIENKEVTTAKQVINVILESRTVPDDNSFREDFKVHTLSKQHQARYFLRELEVGLRSEKEREFVPNSDAKEITLEHVIPKRQNSSWPMDSKLHSELVKRLGNMTLLRASKNNQLGGVEFSRKKEVFKTSDLRITNSLGNLGNFSKNEIDQRQTEFAETAVKVWGI